MPTPRGLTVVSFATLAIVSGHVTTATAASDRFEPIVEGFDFAVNLAPLRDGRILVAEKATGAILVVEDGALRDEPLITLPVDATNNETGLLGLAADPRSPRQPWIYAYFSDVRDGMNRLVRFRVEGDHAGEPETLFDEIATTGIHNGGDLAFGTDGTLFLVTGDGAEESSSQDPNDPRGKVLRFEPDGSIPKDDPTAGSPVFASGIRNSFGLCVDVETGDLWETENGPDSWDEVNMIRPGENYGWPNQLGPGDEPGFAEPVVAFETIIVPTGCVAEVAGAGSGLYFGDYRGALHRIVFPGMGADDPTPRDEVLTTFDDGITDVAEDRGGRLYVLTGSTLYRAVVRAGPESPSAEASGEPTSPPPSTSASPSSTGFGSALRSTAGIVVLGLLALGFVWLRSRALRR